MVPQNVDVLLVLYLTLTTTKFIKQYSKYEYKLAHKFYEYEYKYEYFKMYSST